MANYLLQINDEESFFQRVRKIVKEELNFTKRQLQEKKSTIPYIKATEVMELLQVSRPTINDWVSKGFFTKNKIRSRTFFNRDEIIEFLSKQGKSSKSLSCYKFVKPPQFRMISWCFNSLE